MFLTKYIGSRFGLFCLLLAISAGPALALPLASEFNNAVVPRASAIPRRVFNNWNFPPSRYGLVSSSESSIWSTKIQVTLNRLYPDATVIEAVWPILRKNKHLLALLVKRFPPALKGLQQPPRTEELVEVSLLNSSEPNAFARPAEPEHNVAARIFLSKGLLEELKSESELAFVLGHEMAHIEENDFSPAFPSFMFTPKQLAHILKVHQDWEHRADRKAIEQMEKVGYETTAPLNLLQRLSTISITRDCPFVDHHPKITERLSRIKTRLLKTAGVHSLY